MDFVVADVATSLGEDLSGATRRDLRALGRRYYDKLPEAWRGLFDLVRWAEDGGAWPRIDSEHPAYFYTLRAKDHKDADMVNMLLAELSPMDVRQLFICHKEAFYRAIWAGRMPRRLMWRNSCQTSIRWIRLVRVKRYSALKNRWKNPQAGDLCKTI